MENWRTLNTIEDIDAIIEASNHKPQIIFKHSTTCGISANAHHKLETDFSELEGKVDFYYLDLLANRPVSNAVADKTGVLHQSPQIILLKNGEVAYTVTHLAINPTKIAEHL